MWLQQLHSAASADAVTHGATRAIYRVLQLRLKHREEELPGDMDASQFSEGLQQLCEDEAATNPFEYVEEWVHVEDSDLDRKSRLENSTGRNDVFAECVKE